VIRWLLVLAAAVHSAAAKAPKISDIDFYGLRKLAPERVLAALEPRSGALKILSGGRRGAENAPREVD
jgi:outer membrane protein assembly factor BamA